MFKAVSIGALTIAGALALSGCQLFDAPRLAETADRQIDEQNGMSASHGLAIEEGRRHLRANRSGMAIDAFNRGLAQGEDPAAAYNGLGVAYARIGRSDLAYRFFKKAAASDPDNPVYWRNLALLIDTPEFRLAAVPKSGSEASATNLTVTGVTPSPKAEGAQLVRNGNHQFSLVTVTTEKALTNSGNNLALASCETSTKTKSCRKVALPESGSRNRDTSKKALAEGTSSRASNPSKDPAATAGPVQPPSGKRRTIDLTGFHSEAKKDEAKPKLVTGSNEPA